jgi:hypothetical protein
MPRPFCTIPRRDFLQTSAGIVLLPYLQRRLRLSGAQPPARVKAALAQA